MAAFAFVCRANLFHDAGNWFAVCTLGVVFKARCAHLLQDLQPLGFLDRKLDGGLEGGSAWHTTKRAWIGCSQAPELSRYHDDLYRYYCGEVYHEKANPVDASDWAICEAVELYRCGSRQAWGGN